MSQLCTSFLMCRWVQGALSSHLCLSWRGEHCREQWCHSTSGKQVVPSTAIATRCMGRHRSRAQWPEQHCMMVYFVWVPVSCRLCFVKPRASHLFTLGWFFNPVKLARQDCPSQEDLLLCLFCPTLSLFLSIGRLRTELCAFFYETKIIFETFVD